MVDDACVDRCVLTLLCEGTADGLLEFLTLLIGVGGVGGKTRLNSQTMRLWRRWEATNVDKEVQHSKETMISAGMK